MAMTLRSLFAIDKHAVRGLLAVEWIAIAYLLFTVVIMAVQWDQLVNTEQMVKGRLQFLLVTLAVWGVYRLLPCPLTLFLRIAVQMVFLSWWYPDTYELNRMLPNLDHVFAGLEQQLFGCQPSLLFSQKVPWGWFSELMCMGYVSYFPLMSVLLVYYFFMRHHEFLLSAFVLLTSFFVFYVVFALLPVTGPQFYYLAVGTDNIAQGVLPNVGDWFLTHSERMAPPGWSGGVFHHLLDLAHDAGERPTAAFPSSHVGITTVVMLLAWRTRSRSLFFGMLPFFLLMCLSTVYIYAHYAIDAIAGFLTGLVFYFTLMPLYGKAQKMGLR
ncbi:MAG: phosphatase PAP2 family protein [Prevotella sp.]|nr:phosphatase PAP2 family protein [Prevotella sp.]